MNRTIFAFLFSMVILIFMEPAYSNSWARSFTGHALDSAQAHSIEPTLDGGFIVAGFTYVGQGNSDCWVMKLNSTGDIKWEMSYGGDGSEFANAVWPTSDDGYVVAGITTSFGEGLGDVWVFKLDSTGTMLWQKSYGGKGSDEAFSIQETTDGGYIFAGDTLSFGAQDRDAWVVKLNKDGDIVWQKRFGGSDFDSANRVQQTSDGGFIVAGSTESFAPTEQAWIFKLDQFGDFVFARSYGGSGRDVAMDIQEISGGGFIVAAMTNSFGAGSRDVWVFKLTNLGKIQWQKTYGGTEWDQPTSVDITSDGGYIFAGTTHSFGAGLGDMWVVKLDSSGSILWQKAYGATGAEFASSIHQIAVNDDYIVAGSSTGFGSNGSQMWVLRLTTQGDISLFCPLITVTAVTAVNSLGSTVKGNVEVAKTEASILDSTAVVVNTNAIVNRQC